MTWQPVGGPAVVDNSTAQHLAFPFALTTQAGTHVATYRVGTKHGVEPSGYVVASRSTDGIAWQTPVVLSNCEGDERSAKLAQAPDGTIYAAVWAWRTASKSSIRSMLRTSTDDGASWSYPQPLTFPHTSWSAATGLVWHDGALLAAAYGADGGEQYVALSTGVVVASGGGNWQEPALLIHGDEILCFLRYEAGGHRRIYLSRSLDGGQTWTMPAHILDGGGQPAPHLASDGTILFAFRALDDSCSWASSADGGHTWTPHGRYVDWNAKWVYGDWLTVDGNPTLVSAFEPSITAADVYATTFVPNRTTRTEPAINLTVDGDLAVGATIPAAITVNGVMHDGEAVIQSVSEGPPTMSLGIIASAHVPFATTGYATEVLADSPDAFWRLGDASGNLTDSSGNGYDLTLLSGVTYGVTGATSDGDDAISTTTSGFAGMSDTAVWLDETTFSLEIWVKKSSAPSAFSTIMSRYGANASQSAWIFAINTSGQIEFDFRNTSDSYVNGPVGATNICDGNWHHVGISFVSGGTCTLYVDGSSDGTYDATSQTIKTSGITYGIFIGRRGNDQNGLAADFDEAAFYGGVALSSARYAAHYAAA